MPGPACCPSRKGPTVRRATAFLFLAVLAVVVLVTWDGATDARQGLDPNGQPTSTNDGGPTIDPNGRPIGDGGPTIDPDGRPMADGGPTLDPNGQPTSTNDGDARGQLDPND